MIASGPDEPGGPWLRHAELPYQKLADETVVVDPGRRQVHLLNETAGRLWELLEAPRSLPELVAALREEYDVAADEARGAVIECLDDLASKGLVVAVDEGQRRR